jgi:chromosome segregation ATPase
MITHSSHRRPADLHGRVGLMDDVESIEREISELAAQVRELSERATAEPDPAKARALVDEASAALAQAEQALKGLKHRLVEAEDAWAWRPRQEGVRRPD